MGLVWRSSDAQTETSRKAKRFVHKLEKIAADDPSEYRTNLEKSLVVVLLSLQVLVFTSPRLTLHPDEPALPQITIDVENIPVTRQLHRSAPPPKPTVPVPSDDETIPEEETIVETDLKLTTFFDNSDGLASPSVTLTPARPIAWVFPEYPEEEKKKGVEGIVKLSIHIDASGKVVEVIVLENTTNSDKCARAAVEAAYGSRFFPAREGGKTVGSWISQPYRFDIKD